MADSNADSTTPAQASSLRKGGHIVIKGHPCKVVDMSTSKTGKHGHAKIHFIAIDIFTTKKLEELCPSTHNVQVPVVKRSDLGLIDISDEGYCSCLLDNGDTKDDLKMPEGDLGDKIRSAFDEGKEVNVCVVAAMGQEQIQNFKIQN